jgi:hypothetical protein
MTWIDVLEHDWLAKLVVAPGEESPVIEPEAAYLAAVRACAPFVRGTRFHALPAVRFSLDDARVPAPRDYLPSAGEPLARYLNRLGDGFALTVTEPLFPYYPLWTRLRAALTRLWRRVGHPLLPVTTELTIARGRCEEEFGDPNGATVAFVLGGTATAATSTGDELRLATGDVLHLPPAANRFTLRGAESLLMLRVAVRLDRRAPVAELLQLIAAAAEPHDRDLPVPYVPPPPVAGGIGPEQHAVPVVVTDDQVAAIDIEREQSITWLGRVSTAGLEPAPPPREDGLAETDVEVRLVEDIYTMPDPGGGRTLWAVNGHVFTVAGDVPEQVRRRLMTEDSVSVEALCRDEDGNDNGAFPLVRRLSLLRAIETAGGEAE